MDGFVKGIGDLLETVLDHLTKDAARDLPRYLVGLSSAEWAQVIAWAIVIGVPIGLFYLIWLTARRLYRPSPRNDVS